MADNPGIFDKEASVAYKKLDQEREGKPSAKEC